ncbi:MAG: nitroreductase family protein [Candidatus Altiarchaeota archaeon]
MGGTEKEWLLDVIKTRRSIRAFMEDHPVSDDEIDAILESARWAPSARNIQPLEYVVIRDPEKRRRIAFYSRQEQPAQSPVVIVVLGDLKKARAVGDISPHDVTTHWKGIKKFLYQDAAAAIQNMLLATHSMGLGSLWIGAFDNDGLEEYLGLTDRYNAIAVICIGKEAVSHIKPPKRKMGDVVHWEKWEDRNHDDSYLEYSHVINTPLEDEVSRRKRE